jgi:DNA-binding MarR family transcriptional regulator
MRKDAAVRGRSVVRPGPSIEECLAMGMTCACYNLRRTSRAVTQVFDAHFDAIGLKTTQFTVLAALSYESEGRPTVSHLASALVLEQSSLSRNLAVLERQGLLVLEPGEDKRERIVTLTRAGRAMLTRGYPVWKAAQAAVAGALGPSDFDAQLRSLRRMARAALALRPPRAPRAGKPVSHETSAKSRTKTVARAS